jgi:hypothetical protein
MLRIGDEEIRPRHRGELRVLVAATRPAGLGQVRAYLTADLLRRYAERSKLAPSVVDFAPDGENDLRAVGSALNIHPPRHTLAEPFAIDQLDGLFHDGLREPVFDIGIRLADQPPGARPPGIESPDETLVAYWIDVPPEAEEVGLGAEPLDVRLNLLGFDGDATEALGHWRKRVAEWARSPSGAMSRPHAERIGAAFHDGLDAKSALLVLTELDADDSVPDGVKFETFASADRMFGLDLARDIGK